MKFWCPSRRSFWLQFNMLAKIILARYQFITHVWRAILFSKLYSYENLQLKLPKTREAIKATDIVTPVTASLIHRNDKEYNFCKPVLQNKITREMFSILLSIHLG